MHQSRHLAEQIKELKCEIEGMKVSERETELDRLHEENVQRGQQNKYITLQKVRVGGGGDDEGARAGRCLSGRLS